jgi:chorismate mutase/prephenate dehydratase
LFGGSCDATGSRLLWDNHVPDPSESKQLVVGYQGTDGAYSQIAARRHFAASGDSLVTRGYDSFAALLEAVARGDIAFAMQPIENTTAGSINDAYDLLARMDLHLVGEEVLRVEHCLVALPDTPLDAIRRVYSHPQALLQCTDFLAGLRDCAVLAFTDTAMAVKKVRDEKLADQAAVGSELAAELYGLSVVTRDIANQRNNFTRFVVVANAPAAFPSGELCKTSLILSLRHERGVLARCLNILADHDLSLTKIESRPMPNTPWEYVFYVDFEGNVADAAVAEAVEAVRANTVSLRVLGSYPARTWR